MNNPKKFNGTKAWKERPNEYNQGFKEALDWLAEYIPAHEANFTNVEQVQRINKFLESDEK